MGCGSNGLSDTREAEANVDDKAGVGFQTLPIPGF